MFWNSTGSVYCDDGGAVGVAITVTTAVGGCSCGRAFETGMTRNWHRSRNETSRVREKEDWDVLVVLIMEIMVDISMI